MENVLTDALTAVVIVALISAGYVVIHMLNGQHRQSIATHTYGRTLWEPQNRAAARALRGEPSDHGAHRAHRAHQDRRHGHYWNRLRLRGPWVHSDAHSHGKHGSGAETADTGSTGSTGSGEPPRP